MPALPQIDVTTAQLTRLTNAFPGATNAEKADAYRKFVINRLIDYVLQAELTTLEGNLMLERQVLEDALAVKRRDMELAIQASLPPRP